MSLIPEKYLNDFIRTIPRPYADDLRLYLKQLQKSFLQRSQGQRVQEFHPYWVLLPRWLWKKYNNRLHGLRKNFVDEILWAQYCMYFFIRIQDDIFDKQTANNQLIFPADLFLFEADRIFEKYFVRSSLFWHYRRESLRSTVLGIIDVDRLQKLSTKSSEKLSVQYARVCSIFKLGSVAFCIKAKAMKDFPSLESFADELAIAGQIVDDIQDMAEDLKEDRFNYVWAALFESANTIRNPKQQLDAPISTDGIIGSIFSRIRAHVQRASQSIEPIGLPDAKKYLEQFSKRVDRFETSIHPQSARILRSA